MPAAEAGAESDGLRVQTPGLCGHVCCWGDGGNCILRLQQAIIWDAQTDADWINETGKQPPAEGLLHVRLLFAETRGVRLHCVICLPCLWHRMFSHLMQEKNDTQELVQVYSETCLETFWGFVQDICNQAFLWVVYLVVSVCAFWGEPRFWLMSIDAQIDVAKHLLPLSFPKLLLLEPHFHQGNSLRFTQQQCDAPVNPSPSLIDGKQPF